MFFDSPKYPARDVPFPDQYCIVNIVLLCTKTRLNIEVWLLNRPYSFNFFSLIHSINLLQGLKNIPVPLLNNPSKVGQCLLLLVLYFSEMVGGPVLYIFPISKAISFL